MPFDNSPATLADVIVKLDDLHKLSETRRRDLISAITRTARFLNRAPADLPTEVPALRKVLATIHPAQAGVSAKSLANVKANLATALRLTRFIPRDMPTVERTATWNAFFERAGAKHQEWALARFATYCCSRGIETDAVSDTVMAAFQSHLDTRLLGKDPAILCKEMAQTWNGIVARNALPLATLTYAPNPQHRCRPLTAYPVSLQDEIAAYLKRRAVVDLFDEDGPDKALRPTSLRNTKAHIIQFLDALVNAGADPAKIGSLSGVVTSAQMKTAFTAHIERTGSPLKSGSLQNIAATLVVVARDHLRVSPHELEAMLSVKKRVSTNPKGMSAKNSQRLLQFNDWQNVARLVSLPQMLMDRARVNPATRSSALLAMHAVSMSILLSCPMRVKNLVSLDLERHITPHRNGTHTLYSIRIEGAEVKNHEAIEVKLGGAKSALLRSYISLFRGQLSNVKGTALFPRASDGLPRTPDNFGSDLKALICRETGLVMNTHLFRHLAAKIYLDSNPGHYETVRRLLKHKTVQTTIDFYAELSSQHAHDSYNEILSKFGGRYD